MAIRDDLAAKKRSWDSHCLDQRQNSTVVLNPHGKPWLITLADLRQRSILSTSNTYPMFCDRRRADEETIILFGVFDLLCSETTAWFTHDMSTLQAVTFSRQISQHVSQKNGSMVFDWIIKRLFPYTRLCSPVIMIVIDKSRSAPLYMLVQHQTSVHDQGRQGKLPRKMRVSSCIFHYQSPRSKSI